MEEAPAAAFHLSFHIWEDTYRLLLTDALEIRFIDVDTLWTQTVGLRLP
jgi:hypothetical protein